MSAGVAVTFGEKFGKPTTSDLVSSRLTRQKSSFGSTVYSIVTKDKHFMKPKPQDYDLAFDQLMADFKKNKFKKLICSPMGCVRDRINPYHFAAKISEFQRTTGAKVEIISYDQSALRVLRNGLSHEEFNARLLQCLSIHHLRHMPAQSSDAAEGLECFNIETTAISPVSSQSTATVSKVTDNVNSACESEVMEKQSISVIESAVDVPLSLPCPNQVSDSLHLN